MQTLLKEGSGGDHVAVKVKLPSGVQKVPLGGEGVYTGVPGKSGPVYMRPGRSQTGMKIEISKLSACSHETGAKNTSLLIYSPLPAIPIVVFTEFF